MPIKIIDLTAEAAPTDDDLIIIRDNLSGTTRKITRTVFFQNPPLPAGSITSAMLADGSVSKVKLGADAKISVRSYNVANPATLTVDSDNYDMAIVTALAQTCTIAAPTGTPVNGQGILFRFKDNGTGQTLSWNAIFRAVGVTIPTATVANKMTYVAARYNSEALKWDVLSVGREA